MRVYRRLGSLIDGSQQAARCARNAVCGVVRMVHTRARSLDMWSGVSPETPFRQRRKAQHQLSRDQEADRRQPERRWKNDGASMAGHDWRSVAALTPEDQRHVALTRCRWHFSTFNEA
jgi:hypothetical protein